MDFCKILRAAIVWLCEPAYRSLERWQVSLGFILLGKPDAPAAPDFKGAAQAEGQASVQTAIANAILNRPTQNSPYGTQSWRQAGSTLIPAYGDQPAVNIPNFESNINMTREGQQLFDADTAVKLGLSQAGKTSLGQVQDSLARPFDLGYVSTGYNDKVADAMYGRSLKNLDPQWEMEEERQKTALINSGFSVGNEGYERAMDDFGRRKSGAYGDARDRSIIAGTEYGQRDRNQIISELLLQRQQPLTELNALRTGAAPNMPAFASGNVGANAQGANLLGAATAANQAENDIYNVKAGNYNSTMGTIGGLAGTAGGIYAASMMGAGAAAGGAAAGGAAAGAGATAMFF